MKKIQITSGGIFLTHTVEWAEDLFGVVFTSIQFLTKIMHEERFLHWPMSLWSQNRFTVHSCK